ncbi:MAG: M24 family metallopeptidase [bacterium]
MGDQKERLVRAVSDAELQRRWDLARAMMRERKLDYLVMQTSEEFLGGTVRWFSDWTARHQFPMTVIFPVDEDMTVINCGVEPPNKQVYPPHWSARGIKNNWGDVYFPTMSYTSTYDARLAVEAMRGKKKATIGWVEPTFIPMTFADYLRTNMSGADFVDATEWVDEIRVPKSAEEIELIGGTAAIQDACVEHLKKTITPGMHDYEVYAETHCFMSKHGSSRGLVLVNSGPLGTFVPFDVYHLQGRVIQEGDQVSLLNETNGPGGMYAELLRIFVVHGEPTQALRDAFATAVEAQELVAKAMIPGAACRDLFRLFKDFITGWDYAPPLRSFAHGQGYPLVERPNLRPDETWALKADMNIAVHPYAAKPGEVWSMCCDNFLVGDPNGAERLHKYPKELIVI